MPDIPTPEEDKVKEFLDAVDSFAEKLKFASKLMEQQKEIYELLVVKGVPATLFIKEDGSGIGVMEGE